MPRHVQIKRAYHQASDADGYRDLVDRLWPLGIRKEDLPYDEWCKDLAPRHDLRKWFRHKLEHRAQCRDSHAYEIDTSEHKDRMHALIHAAGRKKMTLVYGAKDPDHNHALILAAELNGLY